jgi:pilus assembly protein Flp/PilA
MGKRLERMWRCRLWRDTRGQDLVEYALLAGFIAVAAGVFIPDVTDAMSTIYSRVASKLVDAGG